MHLDGLLHLAALGVAVSLAYVGLDRIRPSEEKLEKEIDSVKEFTLDILTQMEVMPNADGTIDEAYRLLKLFVLFHVAEIKVNKGWRKPIHAVNKHRYVPLLSYFRRRDDLKAVSLLCFASTLIFLYLTAAVTWEEGFPVADWFVKFTFVWYVVLLTWIVVTVYASHKLFRIRSICERLDQDINNYFLSTATASFRASSGRVASPPDPQIVP